MADLVFPSSAELEKERDPSKRLIALVEPASIALTKATKVYEVNEIRGQAEALARYARTITLSGEAIGAAQVIARRAEIRMGELIGPSPGRGRPGQEEISTTVEILSKDERHQFRQLADADKLDDVVVLQPEAPGDPRPTNEQIKSPVERALEELAPQGKATRRAVLKFVKLQQVMDQHEEEVSSLDRSPIKPAVSAETSMRYLLTGLKKMKSHGQTFSVAPLAERIVKLCDEIKEHMQ